MQQSFNYFGMPETPYIVLVNPNREEIFSLGLAYDTKLSLKFNTLSEFSFTFPKSVDNGVTVFEAYDYLQNKRLVLVEGIGYFQIVNAEENMDGSVPVKRVECKSQESELIQKSLVYGGTKKLYDILNSAGTILQDMIELAPNWTVGNVDAELLLKFRTFDVKSNIYNFLVSDVSNAFECVFIFDTINRTISAKTLENATIETDIFLSFDNVIKKANFSEKSDEITTALNVFGDGNLSINLVNPLGTNYIYNFDYYKNTNWMTQALVDAVSAWETLVDSVQPEYANDLTLLSGYNAELLVLESELATLNEEYLALESVQKSRIQLGLPYSDITAQMTAKQNEINAKNILITNKETQITEITAELQTIHDTVSFANNFTPEQLLELNNFIFENSYLNSNIIKTDSMTTVEVQVQAQILYDQAQNVLGRVSQPRYEVDLESVNYVNLAEFSIFTNQTELGCIVTCELKDGTYIEIVLLEINMQFDNPENFSFTFSNRLRLDNGNFKYSDLMGEVQKTGSAVSFDSASWSNWSSDYKDDVTSFITSSLDATTNNLISNSNQEILINQNGLRARQSTGSGTYNNKQAWLVNNVLAFSDDGFLTSKLALGEIPLPAGGTAYGLVADTIVGRLLAGNTLTITNATNNFVLDQTGATLNNAKFNVQTTNTKIIIDPTATRSFVIQKNQGGTFVDKFVVNNSGDVIFSGTLSGANGTFSGTITATVGNIGTLVIDSQGLKTADGINYLRGDGSLKWGGLTISGGSASFTGDIFASRLIGHVVDDQIASGLDAGKMTYGSMSGNRLYGGTPSLSGINPTSSSLSINGALGVANQLTVDGSLLGTNATFGGSLFVGGSLAVSGGTGLSLTVTVTTPFGTRYLVFSRGILISYHA